MSHPLPESRELPQLDYDILDYLTTRSRIMSAYKLATWSEFTSYYHNQYSDYSREALRSKFITEILPKIFAYNLTDIQQRKIEIFATHYHFTRSEEGFLELPCRRSHLAVEGVHYVRSDAAAQSSGLACVISGLPAKKASCPDPKTNAWASAIISTDGELVRYCIYRGARLRSRMTETWKHFQKTGQIPENLNPSVGKKIAHFRNKAETLSAMIRDSSF